MTVHISPPDFVVSIIFWRKSCCPLARRREYCDQSFEVSDAVSEVPKGGLATIISASGLPTLQFCADAAKLSSARMFVCPSPAIIMFIFAEDATLSLASEPKNVCAFIFCDKVSYALWVSILSDFAVLAAASASCIKNTRKPPVPQAGSMTLGFSPLIREPTIFRLPINMLTSWTTGRGVKYWPSFLPFSVALTKYSKAAPFESRLLS